MPVTELIETLEEKGLTVNQAHKALKDLNVPTTGDISEEDRDLVLAHVTQPKPQPETGKGELTRTKRQTQAKGALTEANQNLGKAAIASTQKQMRTLANTASTEGLIAFADQTAQNSNAIAAEIFSYSDRACEIIAAVEAEFALGDDDDSPLALPASDFSLL